MLKYIFPIFFVISVFSAENSISDPMVMADRLFEKGDFLFAARIYKYIQETSTDSNRIPEAIYKYKKCGDDAADLFTSKLYFQGQFYLNTDLNDWIDYFDNVFQAQMQSYQDVDICIKCQKYFDLYCVNVDTTTLKLLSTTYKNTYYGELASFELITNEMDGSGFPAHNHPESVIEKANSFNKTYPNSIYLYDVYFILGKAYSDLWNFYVGKDYTDLLPDKYHKNPDIPRKEAIKYYTLVQTNQDKLNTKYATFRWSQFYDKQLDDLKNKKETRCYHYFGD